jgi:hypothetical protein
MVYNCHLNLEQFDDYINVVLSTHSVTYETEGGQSPWFLPKLKLRLQWPYGVVKILTNFMKTTAWM